jgi:hypothetical protein
MAKAKDKSPLEFNGPQTGELTGKPKVKRRERDTKYGKKGEAWKVSCFAVFSGVGLLVELKEEHPEFQKVLKRAEAGGNRELGKGSTVTVTGSLARHSWQDEDKEWQGYIFIDPQTIRFSV